ncbi:MAG TPA: FAD-dependent oxidoreductase, partial [Kofleriaceae bacterium]
MKVAIIGSGIAGLGAAYTLAGRHDVTIFEAAAKPGGHVYTVEADGHAIDMGFIVCNRERYTCFMAMLAELGIATRPTTMAFSVADGDLEWSSASLSAMFADRKKLASPRHWAFLVEVVRLLATFRRDLAAPASLATMSLDDYLVARRVSARVREHFIVPLAAALWSLAPDICGEFPALSYLAFLDQHGMLRPFAPLKWHTIVGGSQRYVDALVALLKARGAQLRLSTRVRSIERDAGGVTIGTALRDRFDRVIVATHADTALSLLSEPTAAERAALSAIRYSDNRTVLHTDRSFLPARKAAHASWNYVADPDTARVAVTYSMTALQGLPDVPYLVTLNPRREPRGILHEVTFAHPQLDRD